MTYRCGVAAPGLVTMSAQRGSVRIMRRRLTTATAALVAGLTAVVGLAAAAPAQAQSGRHPAWRLIDTGGTNHFRGLAPVSAKIAWLGGYDGQILRTTDGGRHWKDVSPKGASTLQFRDIAATSAAHAVAMAAGSGTDSRLYVTDNGGSSWRLAYQNTNPAAFFDCMSFSDARNGLLLSDPVNGRFRILATANGGHSWRVLSNAGMPAAQTGEAGFAASGECITTAGKQAWFGAGGGTSARVFHSTSFGTHWKVTTTPLKAGASGGIFGVAFRSAKLGIIVGGDFAAPYANDKVAGYSDFGDPWRVARTAPSGYRSGVTFVPGTFSTAISVGLTGSDWTTDAGRHWSTFDTGQFDTVSCASDGACWAAGDMGRVAALTWR